MLLPPRPTLAVGAVVQNDAGRLLVIRRGRPPAEGRWSLPGGKVERGETLAAAVAREVAEETGLVATVGELIGYLEIVDDSHHFVVLDFAATVEGGAERAGGDVTAVAWMGRRELVAAGPTDRLLGFLDQHGIELAL